MTCSSCKFLNESKKYDGKVCGSCYYCSKENNYVNGSNSKCKDYVLSYGRSSYICDKIYNDGEKYYDDNIPNSCYLFLLLVLIILALIFNC